MASAGGAVAGAAVEEEARGAGFPEGWRYELWDDDCIRLETVAVGVGGDWVCRTSGSFLREDPLEEEKVERAAAGGGGKVGVIETGGGAEMLVNWPKRDGVMLGILEKPEEIGFSSYLRRDDSTRGSKSGLRARFLGEASPRVGVTGG